LKTALVGSTQSTSSRPMEIQATTTTVVATAPQPDLGSTRTASVKAVATAALQPPVTWMAGALAIGMTKLITLPKMVDSPKILTWSLAEIKQFNDGARFTNSPNYNKADTLAGNLLRRTKTRIPLTREAAIEMTK